MSTTLDQIRVFNSQPRQAVNVEYWPVQLHAREQALSAAVMLFIRTLAPPQPDQFLPGYLIDFGGCQSSTLSSWWLIVSPNVPSMSCEKVRERGRHTARSVIGTACPWPTEWHFVLVLKRGRLPGRQWCNWAHAAMLIRCHIGELTVHCNGHCL